MTAEVVDPVVRIRQMLLKIADEYGTITRMPNELPHAGGIYFVRRQPFGEILYVGKAVDLRNRWSGHRFRKDVIEESLFLSFKPPDKENFCNLEHEEAAFIVFLRPKWNQMAKCKLYGIFP